MSIWADSSQIPSLDHPEEKIKGSLIYVVEVAELLKQAAAPK